MNTSTPLIALTLALSLLPLQAQAGTSDPTQPVAEELQVQAIESRQGNALVTARFARSTLADERGKTVSTLAIQLEKGPLTLRDDGRGGDQKAGDGLYSAITWFDFEALIRRHAQLTQALEKFGERALPPHFQDRALVGHHKPLPPEIIKKRLAAGLPIPLLPLGNPSAIDPERSLVIRDPAVVEDPSRTHDRCSGGNPNGAWSFKHLVTQMANTPQTGIPPEEFVRLWLATWESDQVINGWTVANRATAIRNLIIDPWEARSGGPGTPLDLNQHPFKLIAIVNRVDLRDNAVYGGGSAGEGRFVFQVMDDNCNPTPFTVIFEYGIEKNSCTAVRDWGRQWADLSGLPLGSAAYNAALQAITDQFTAAGAAPHKPNGSALNQIRSNEIALGAPWELREFVISANGWDAHLLRPNTVAQTPDLSLNGTPTLRDFVNSGATTVPLRFPTLADPFLGGSALTPFQMFWDHPGISPRSLRHRFSLDTCNGCHAGETNTLFTHINPGTPPVTLSGFMTGIDVADPADGTPVRHFDELTRRQADLDALVHSACLIQLAVPVLTAPH